MFTDDVALSPRGSLIVPTGDGVLLTLATDFQPGLQIQQDSLVVAMTTWANA